MLRSALLEMNLTVIYPQTGDVFDEQALEVE